jgi:predicted MPP superfamily phosphohydrolase
MRILAFDLAVNLAMLAVDAAILVVLLKKRDLRIFALIAAGMAVGVGLFLSLFVVGLFGAMRALAWVIFAHGVIVLAGGAILLWKSRRKWAISSAVLGALVALVGIDAFFIEPHWLEVTRVQISSPKLKRPLRIAIIADIQTDEVGDYERDVLRRVAAEKPDLVLFAGDYIQIYEPDYRSSQNAKLRQAILEARLEAAALAVEGNCDFDDWPEIFDGTGVHVHRQTTTIQEGEVRVTALSLIDSEYGVAVPPSEHFQIAVGHRPDFARNAAIQADLLVAGHTHGGQVRLPLIGPLITLSHVPRSWAAGVTNLSGGRTLIVARGIGMERGPAPRLRFLCRPELVIVDVFPVDHRP